MQLMELMESYPDVAEWVGGSVDIEGITPNLQRVLPGYLFVAMPGSGEEGPERLYEALLEGAVAALGEWQPEELPENLPWGAFVYVRVLDATRAWFWLCEKWGSLCKLGTEPA